MVRKTGYASKPPWEGLLLGFTPLAVKQTCLFKE